MKVYKVFVNFGKLGEKLLKTNFVFGQCFWSLRSLRQFTEVCGSLRQFMEVYGSLWKFMEVYGSVRKLQTHEKPCLFLKCFCKFMEVY